MLASVWSVILIPTLPKAVFGRVPHDIRKERAPLRLYLRRLNVVLSSSSVGGLDFLRHKTKSDGHHVPSSVVFCGKAY